MHVAEAGDAVTRGLSSRQSTLGFVVLGVSIPTLVFALAAIAAHLATEPPCLDGLIKEPAYDRYCKHPDHRLVFEGEKARAVCRCERQPDGQGKQSSS